MAGLLFPAYQKFYSAISSLERFESEQNFFDNISCLDNFFAEYRNITFVIQAALKHTEFYSFYEDNRDKYLIDHWFVDKRNEITKQKPFQLVKEISITIYLPYTNMTLYTQSFTVEDDVPMSSLINDFKTLFKQFSPDEVFFSAAFSFFEKETRVDLWDKLNSGIVSMQQFMAAMYGAIGENCALCNQLIEKIRKSKYLLVSKDFWLIHDYVYYPRQDSFEGADKLAVILDKKKVISRGSLKKFIEHPFNFDGTAFGKFVYMHALIRVIDPCADIMPAILIIYNDNTFDLEAFHSNIKTTMYRKIAEVSQLIKNENVCQVCIVTLYSCFTAIQDIPKTSKERIKASSKDILIFMSVDHELNEMEYVFDGEAVSNIEYVVSMMKNGRKDKLEISKLTMLPIIQAFESKKENNK